MAVFHLVNTTFGNTLSKKEGAVKKLSLMFCITFLAGCAITPDNIDSFSTADLCRSYGAPLNPNYMSPLVRNELIARGASHCADPSFISANQASSLELLRLGTDMLRQSQPQPMYSPPQPSKPMNCRIFPNPYGDRIVCQ